MADSTVGALTAASALTGTELFYGVQAANDVKVTASQIATFTGGGGGGTTILDGNGAPASGLGSAGDYYVDDTGNQLYGPKAVPGAFGPNQMAIPPGLTPTGGGSGNYEIGNHAQAAVAGQIVAVRYWRDAATPQIARTVNVWTTAGTLLSSGSVANDGGGSGWKQITLTTPVSMLAGATVVVSVGTTANYVQTSAPGFPISNGGDVSVINGAYVGGTGGFPSNVVAINYFVDVVFQAVAPVWPMAVDGDVAAIGGVVTGGTAGDVLFVNTSGNLGQDSTFTWDNTLKNLHVGGQYYVGTERALYVVPNITENNWFEGNAGNLTVSGYGNFGTGDLALSSLTTGFDNVAVGTNAMKVMTSGNNNFALGSNTMFSSVSDLNNVAIGNIALNHLGSTGTTNQYNIAVGYAALTGLSTGEGNIAIGYLSLGSAGGATTVRNNTIIGIGAGNSLGVGGGASVISNTLIGDHAGTFLNGTSSYNTWIGGFGGPAAQVSNSIVLTEGSGQYFLIDCHVTKPFTWSINYSPGLGIPPSLHIYNKQDALGVANNYERGIFDWFQFANVFWLGTQAGGTGVKRLLAIDGFAKAGAPAAGDLPAGSFALIDDTSGGATWLCFNKAGTIRKVQLT